MIRSYPHFRTTKKTFNKTKKCNLCDTMISSGMTDHQKTNKCKRLRLKKYINLF